MNKNLFILLLLLLIPFPFIASPRSNVQEPLVKISNNGGNEKLVLSLKLANYLESHFKKYRLPNMDDKNSSEDWRSFVPKGTWPPVYVMGDFNGDQWEDVALLLIGPENDGILVSLHQNNKGSFENYELDRLDRDEIYRMGLARKKAGNLSVIPDGGDIMDKKIAITLANDGIDYFVFESASSVLFWNGKKYERVWTSD